MIIITYQYDDKYRTAIGTALGPTDGIRWTINPGSGDFPVGQFDAQNLFPKGNGMPSLANSMIRK